MEKKAKECRSWKLRACRAEKELKLMNSVLTQSQLEDLRRQNVDPLSMQSDTGADSSLEIAEAVMKPASGERHSACVTEHTVSEDN